MEIPAPRFEIYETVKPTPDATIKPASPVGKVESRSWVEFAERPGYWRYTVRWPGGGTSSGSDEYLDKGCRVDCGLRVVVSGVPVIVRSWTTQSVDAAIAMALKTAGVSREGATGWTLRTEGGAELKHMVGDAKLEDEGETTLFLDPDVGGGGDDEPSEAEAAGQVWPKGSPERRLIERGGKDAVMRDLADGAGWKGTPPAEGTRRKLILDALEAFSLRLISGDEPGPSSCLGAADAVESALLKSTIAEEADVRPGTRELRIVLEDVSDPDGPPEYRFIELEDQDGAGVGGFPIRSSSTPPLKEIAIPYGRDNAWVTEVAYQAAGAATRPLLEDHPDYVFPAERVQEAVAYLLSTFGIPRACHGCQEEQLEHGRKEAAVEDRGDDAPTEESYEDRLLRQREEARAGEDHFKAQRDSALHLVRWLIGDIIPPDLIRLSDCDEEAR